MAPQEAPLSFSVPRRLADARLDFVVTELVREAFPESVPSRKAIASGIREGQILLNGSPAKPLSPVSYGDTILFPKERLPQPEEGIAPLSSKEVALVWENGHFALFHKSGNISMHPVAGRKASLTVAHAVLAEYPETATVGESLLRPGIVHRLDRETSGIFVVAKTSEAYTDLKKAFQSRNVRKSYIALVHGRLREEEGTIDAPIERVIGTLKRKVGRKMTERARAAVTEYRVLMRYQDYDLVLVQPKTGRTHQIRAHFSSLGHPIAGDKLYGSKLSRSAKEMFPRHMLHAAALEWRSFGELFAFAAPLSRDFETVLADIDETREAGYDSEALKSLFSDFEGRGFFVSQPF